MKVPNLHPQLEITAIQKLHMLNMIATVLPINQMYLHNIIPAFSDCRRIFLLLLLLILLFASNVSAQSSEAWVKSSNGLEYKELIAVKAGSLGKQLFAARISSDRHGLKVLRAQDFGKRSMSAREICLASGALLCINASFFDEKDSPLGLLISSGITFQRPHLGGDTLTGIFASTRKSFSILGRDELNSALFIEAVQAGPRLVLDSKAVAEFKDQEVSRRSGICLDAENKPIFFVTTLDSWAISLSEFAQAMESPEFRCKDGLNFDGGGSAQLFMRTANGKNILASEKLLDIRGQDEAPVFLAVVEGLKF